MRYSCEKHCLWCFIESEISDEQHSVKLRSQRRDFRCIGGDHEKKQGVGHREIRRDSAPSWITDYLRSSRRLGSTREDAEVLAPFDFVENLLERRAEYEAVVNAMC